VAFLRRAGAHIGTHVRIRRGAYIVADEISIGDGVIIEPDAHIVCGTLRMGTECKIDSETVVFGEGQLIMEDGSYIGPRAWINTAATVRLGRGTGIGPGSMVFTHGVWLPHLEGFPRSFEDVILEDHVWIPANVTILPGVRVGEGAIIGAGSVLNKSVAPHMFVAGVPAKEVSPVEKLRGPMTPESRDQRAREMFEDFARLAERKGWRLRRGQAPILFHFGTRRGADTAVAYFTGVMDGRMLQDLVTSRGGPARILLVALDGFAPETSATLLRHPSVDWFDLATHVARRSWHHDTVVFRRHLASHWGLHLILR